MEVFYPLINSPWQSFMPSSYLYTPQNYVHWTETPHSHLYTARLPGVRKEDIRVEVEDSLYLVIRTELAPTQYDYYDHSSSSQRDRSFMRKFRLPGLVNIDNIAANYEDGVLTVTVPRSVGRQNLRINAEDLRDENSSVAPAA